MVPFHKNHLTTQRQIILDYLMSRRDHPSATEIYAGVREVLPRLSLGTVYRTLDLLSRLGAVRIITTTVGCRRYDADTSDHVHIICVRCGRTEDLPLSTADIIKTDIPTFYNYDILAYDVVVRGVCPRCREKGALGMTAGAVLKGA